MLSEGELGVGWSAAVGFAFGSGEDQVGVGVAGDGPSAFVDQGVVLSAQPGAVRAVGRSAAGPVPDVVHVGEPGGHVTARESACVVAKRDGFAELW